MISIEYHSDLRQVQSDAQISALISAYPPKTPFDRFEWWQGLIEHCAISPLLCVGRNSNDIVILPLRTSSESDRVKDRTLNGLANWYSFHTRPLFLPSEDEPTPNQKSILKAMAADLRSKTDRISLHEVPDEDKSARILTEAFRSVGWFVHKNICDTNFNIDTKELFYDDYVKGLNGKLRNTLSRKSRFVATRVATEFTPEIWADYQSVYADSWKPTESSPDFLLNFAKQESACGRLRLGLSYCHTSPSEDPIAAQLWTVEGGTAFIHKLAYRKSTAQLSPGTVLTAALIKHVLDVDRVSAIDFGTGDDAYKRDWMQTQRPRYKLDILNPKQVRNWPILSKIILRSLAERMNRR